MDTGQVPVRGLDRHQWGFAAPDLALLLTLLLGLALRLPPLARDPLHQDEALYGYWGRLISSGREPWLAGVPVDKPPLVPYLIAGSQAAFGTSEFALRLSALATSLLAIPLIAMLAHELYADRRVARVAAAVMALTPFPVLFGAAGFTDAVLVAAWLAAGVAALKRRWGWAGLMLGLAFASKQQALILAPLVLALGTLGARPSRRAGFRAAGRFVLGLAGVLAAVFGWNAVRVGLQRGGTGFWQQSVVSFGGLRLIWATELVPRLSAWLRLGGYLLGWPALSGLAALGGVGLLMRALAGRRPTHAALTDVALITFALFYLLLHWLVAFPVWDRYLLPLVPILGLLAGRCVVILADAVRRRQGGGLPAALNLILVGALVASGAWAALGRVPVGGDHGAYDGLQEVIAFLKTLPVGTVVYDRWLTWHYDFYLFDAYLYRAGFPSPDWLAADAAAFYDGRPRYLVLPGWESGSRLQRSLARAGLAMTPVLTTYGRDGGLSFTVYEIGSDD